jgi:hypothetical protein
MKKQTTQPVEKRKPGPKFARSVLPENFQIRRSPSPMALILDEAEQLAPASPPAPPTLVEPTEVAPPPERVAQPEPAPLVQPEQLAQPAPEQFVRRKPVPAVQAAPERTALAKLPTLAVFVDEVLPHFPPAQQAILLRLHRWSKGYGQELTVSAPRLAASVNLDEKSVRMHLQKLMSQGFIARRMVGEFTAQFGGADRSARGLILCLDAAALTKLCD